MDIQKRLIGPCSTFLPKTDDVKVDFNALVRRLILFDTYILHSTRLKEIKYLIDAFGYDGIMELLKSGSLKIYCHAISMGQFRQESEINIRNLRDTKIFGPYSFRIIREFKAKRKNNISLHFQKEIDTIDSVSLKKRIKLKHAILDVLENVPENAGVETSNNFKQDLISNSPAIKKALMVRLKKFCRTKIENDDFFVKIHQIKEDDFEAESNLGNILNLGDKIIFDVIQRSILAISSVSQRIEEMKTYNALSGFKEQELPVFQEKLNFLEKSISAKYKENRFQRIIRIKCFPCISIEDTKINIQKLLKIRESKEVKEFREWLPYIDKYSDLEISEKMENLKSKLAEYFNSNSSQIIRFLSYNVIGFISPPIGIILGALDIFLLKKILPKSGPLTFINKLYPSIFNNIK